MRATLHFVVALFGSVASFQARAQEIADGVNLEVVYTADLAANVSGGLRRGVRYVDNLDLTLSLDGDEIGWPGGGLLLYGIGNQGGNITDLVGDAQGVNNIESPTNWRLFEAWVEQAFGERVTVLAGLYDLNSEFDVNRTGVLFINSSHGTGPDLSQSGLNGPSIFPVTSLGARARIAVTHALELRAVVLDGVPGDPAKTRGTHIMLGSDDGLLLAAEVEFFRASATHRVRAKRTPRRMREPLSLSTRLVLGGWTYTKRFDRFVQDPASSAMTSSSRGAYLLAEWSPYREADPAQGLHTFVRVGTAAARVNRFGKYVGMGLVYNGLITGRDADQAGLAIAAAINGNPYIDALSVSPAESAVSRAETNIELTYLMTVAPILQIQADLQYVIDPDTREDIPNALVTTIRVILSP